MHSAPRRVVTRCPRCGEPIVWSLTAFASGAQLEVTGYACHCPLSDDEWDALAADALQERRQAAPMPQHEATTTTTPADTPAPPAPAGSFWARVRRVFSGE